MDLVANKWGIQIDLKNQLVKCVGNGRKNVPGDCRENVEK